ncbi:MAG: hypothetical protein ABIO65_10165, partial [Nitrospiria bacterium]
RRETTVPDGYTGPGREPYVSYFEGVWLYGALTASPLGRQSPIELDVDGDWAVWEDANRSEIYAFNIPAGQGFYITADRVAQHKPRVSDGVVVFEDHRSPNRPAVYAYFLDTGETRRLSNATTVLSSPDIDYPIVSWLDQNGTNADVWAYSLLNDTAWNVHPGTDRDSDPIVVGSNIYWRTYRYNLWDIVGYDTTRDEYVQVTSDSAIQSAPFTNGVDLFYMTSQFELGWRLERFDAFDEVARRYDLRLPDSSKSSISGDALLRSVMDIEYSQLVIRNITNGAVNHVSGNLLLSGDPAIQGRTVFALVRTGDGVSFLMLDVSPFAFAKKPTLVISSPGPNLPWLRPVVVTGVLSAGPEFAEPATFTYRIDDGPPQIIPAGRVWRFTADPTDAVAGSHTVTVRATFREGPPVSATLTLIVPAESQTIDVERAGPAYHAARLLNELHNYVLDNPASWVLIPLLILILILVTLRAWLWLKPRRRRSIVEYVDPDEA